jgi:hypothetical protein
MGHISTLLRRSSSIRSRLARAFGLWSTGLFSRRSADFGRYLESARAHLKNWLPKLHSKLRSLISKMAAKSATSSL